MIETINAKFVPLELYLDKYGFPKELPGLKMVNFVFDNYPLSKLGFHSNVVLTTDGKYPLASAATGSPKNWKTDTTFIPSLYLKMLEDGVKLHNALLKLDADVSATEAEKREAKGKRAEEVVRQYLKGSDDVCRELTGQPLPEPRKSFVYKEE